MKKFRQIIVLVGTLLVTTAFAVAQDKTDSYESGGYLFSGGLNLGYRSASVSALSGGVEDYATRRYYEGFNYRTGIQLSDFNLFGQAKTGTKGFFDELYLNGSGVNDPYTNVGLRLRSFGYYDFRFSLHRSQYYSNRPDSLWSDLHSFDFTRTTINTSLVVDLMKNAALEIDYSGTGRNGNEVITNSTYFYGVTSADFKENNGTAAGTSNYGSLGTNNFYWMNTPRNDQTNDFGAKLNFKFPDINTNVVVGGGTRKFSQDVSYSPFSNQSLTFLNGASKIGTTSPVYSANENGFIGYNIRNESLHKYSWEDKRDGSTPYFFGQVVTKLASWCSLTADFRTESTTGTSTSTGYEDGLMRKTTSWYDSVQKKTLYGVFVKDSTVLQNFYGTSNGTANNTFKRTMASALLTCHIMDGLQFTARVKYTSDEETAATATYLATSRDTTLAYSFKTFHYDTIKSNIKYTNKLMTMSPQFVYAPMPTMSLRAGLTITTRTPLYNLDTVMAAIVPKELYNVNMSKKTTSTTPTISIFYKPIQDLSLRVRYEQTDNKSSFDASTLYNATNKLSPNLGQAYSGTAPQFDLITPDTKNVFNVGADYNIMKDMVFTVNYRMETSKGDLAPWYAYYAFYNNVYTDTTKTKVSINLPATGDLTFKTNISNISAALSYAFDANSMVRLGFNYSENKWSLPFSGLASNLDTNGGRTAPYGDLKTALIDQDIKNTAIDFNFSTMLIDKLRLNLSAFSLTSTGGCVLEPNTVTPSAANTYASGSNATKNTQTPITGFGTTSPRLDMPWVGGPYSSLQLGVGLQYMLTNNFGLGADYQYVKYEEKVVDSYVGLGSYTASMIKFSLLCRL